LTAARTAALTLARTALSCAHEAAFFVLLLLFIIKWLSAALSGVGRTTGLVLTALAPALTAAALAALIAPLATLSTALAWFSRIVSIVSVVRHDRLPV